MMKHFVDSSIDKHRKIKTSPPDGCPSILLGNTLVVLLNPGQGFFRLSAKGIRQQG